MIVLVIIALLLIGLIGGGNVVLKDYQLDALVDKLYPIMIEEIASETLRISQLIEEVR